MKIIGILTSDFRVYYDLIRALKSRDVPFASLSFDEPIPINIGVIITTEDEMGTVEFPNTVVAEDDLDLTIDIALRVLSGKDEFEKVIIGIDPGKRPGIAVIGDGEILGTAQVSSPEKVRDVVDRAMRSYPSGELIVRIGHGDVTHRNRIINSLADFGLLVEISDETRTTRISDTPDIDAAIDIALTSGKEAKKRYKVRPTPGELRDIQRQSRIASKGLVTISREEAQRVAVGEISLDEAIKRNNKTKKDSATNNS